ncbi:MAG: hypothetical protein K2X47_08345 [Bdellovibrionales bacterium]|nr:hypothetical protein [Bdellovibrionales bacterium]
MNLQPVVLVLSDLDRVFEFETRRLLQTIPDEDERMLAQWKSPWRREALEHYLGLGWSMSVNDEAGNMRAYFLAQPFLFTRCQTQTLWIEHIGGESDVARAYALDVAVRLSRDKHLQRVLVQGQTIPVGSLFSPIADQLFEIKTTKG